MIDMHKTQLIELIKSLYVVISVASKLGIDGSTLIYEIDRYDTILPYELRFYGKEEMKTYTPERKMLNLYFEELVSDHMLRIDNEISYEKKYADLLDKLDKEHPDW